MCLHIFLPFSLLFLHPTIILCSHKWKDNGIIILQKKKKYVHSFLYKWFSWLKGELCSNDITRIRLRLQRNLPLSWKKFTLFSSQHVFHATGQIGFWHKKMGWNNVLYVSKLEKERLILLLTSGNRSYTYSSQRVLYFHFHHRPPPPPQPQLLFMDSLIAFKSAEGQDICNTYVIPRYQTTTNHQKQSPKKSPPDAL